MLIIAKHGCENIVRDVFEKWDVPCAEIGRVTEDGMMRVLNEGEIVAEIPAKPLADEAPLYSREASKPPGTNSDSSADFSSLPAMPPVDALHQLLRDPTIASKNWVYRQDHHTVRTGTVVRPGSDAAVFHVKYANKILAATTDCNSLYCALDPRAGGKIAVAEAARNLTCSGARPLAVTDNLNFGNPYKPENFWQLREAVEGLAEACRAFNTPVVGGNVSLYNESPGGVVDPTPTVGMVGLIDHPSHITTQWFKAAGDAVILVAPTKSSKNPNFGASRFLKVCHGRKEGPVPEIDLSAEIAVQNAVRELIRSGLVKSAHDCSEGGIAVALAECCFNPGGLLGASVNCGGRHVGGAGETPATPVEVLFNEAQSRIIVSVSTDDSERALRLLTAQGVEAIRIGTVGETKLSIALAGETFRWPVVQLHDDWWNSIRRAVESDTSTDRVPSL